MARRKVSRNKSSSVRRKSSGRGRTKASGANKVRRRSAAKLPESGIKAITIVNEKLSQLQEQALKAYECIQAIKKRSTPEWKEWINKLSTQDWVALAKAQRDRVGLEVRHLSDEILAKIHAADILVDKEPILREAKHNLEHIINRVNTGNIVDKAIDTAIHTKDGLLAFLNIPTHEEMIELQRKLSRLERKMSKMRPHAR